MTRLLRLGLASSCLALAASSACTAGDRAPPVATSVAPPITSAAAEPPVAKGGGPLSVQGAVTRVAVAQCKRTQRCAMVRQYDSRDQCITVQASTLDEEMSLSCSVGVDSKALAACLDEVSNAVCRAGELDERPLSCRAHVLCAVP